MVFTYGKAVVAVQTTKGDIAYTSGDDRRNAPPLVQDEIYHLLLDNLDNSVTVTVYLERIYGDTGPTTMEVPLRAGALIAIDGLPPEALGFMQAIAAGASAVNIGVMVWSERKPQVFFADGTSVTMNIDSEALAEMVKAQHETNRLLAELMKQSYQFKGSR